MKLIIATTLFLSSFYLYGQQLRGKVTDQLNSPLVGVHVVNQNKGTGITTDIDGNFQIVADAGDSIKISFIGFLDKTIFFHPNTTSVSIELEVDTYRLREFTVKGDRIGHEIHRMPSKEEYLKAVQLGSFLADNPHMAPRTSFSRKSYNDKYQKQKNELPVVIDQERRLDEFYELQNNEKFVKQLSTLYPEISADLDPAFRDFVKDYLQVIYTSSIEEVKASLILFLGDRYRD
ncbi:MAG: carboxypeptidase-like regulatory domain-containing protein [bacterium]|nr:carboxypeptidase-like regulatory domain-containing protein [bacterium]